MVEIVVIIAKCAPSMWCPRGKIPGREGGEDGLPSDSDDKHLHTRILHGLIEYTLWWSVNLSHNWALNVWTVTFIKTPTTINIQVNCNSYYLYWTGCVLWLIEAFTTTHTSGETANQGHLTPSYLILCVSQNARICQTIKICMYTTRKSCPIVGKLELAG